MSPKERRELKTNVMEDVRIKERKDPQSIETKPVAYYFSISRVKIIREMFSLSPAVVIAMINVPRDRIKRFTHKEFDLLLHREFPLNIFSGHPRHSPSRPA